MKGSRSKVYRLGAVTATVLALALLALVSAGHSAASRVLAAQSSSPQIEPTDGRSFPETGFDIADARFLDHFNKCGGLRTFGYPVSRAFLLQGTQVQIFQRRVMQIQPDGSVGLLNLLDPEIMPYTSINFATLPGPDAAMAQLAAATGTGFALQFVDNNTPNTWQAQSVSFSSAFHETVLYEEAYPDGGGDPALMDGINLEMWGLPISAPAVDPNNNDFVYQRFQRGIMHYDRKTGLSQGLLLGAYFNAILTGSNLPADLEAAAKNSVYYGQYNNTLGSTLNRPDQLPGTCMADVFEPGGGLLSPCATAPAATSTPTATPWMSEPPPPTNTRTPTATNTPTPTPTQGFCMFRSGELA